MLALLEKARIYKALKLFADLHGPICYKDLQNNGINLIVIIIVINLIRYNRVKFAYHFRHKLWPKFANRWISRIGSLRFWWNPVQRKALMCSICSREIFTKKMPATAEFRLTQKRRGTITTWHLIRSSKILWYIVHWSICYPCYMLD